jgi:glutathione S-transferase
MRLLIHPASPNCVAVLAVAHRLRSELEVRHVDLFKGEHRKSEFLALNPNGLVPVLQEEDFVLWETLAILQYLGSIEPSPLFPSPATRCTPVKRKSTFSLTRVFPGGSRTCTPWRNGESQPRAVRHRLRLF